MQVIISKICKMKTITTFSSACST